MDDGIVVCIIRGCLIVGPNQNGTRYLNFSDFRALSVLNYANNQIKLNNFLTTI
jgi:hypothetical protein